MHQFFKIIVICIVSVFSLFVLSSAQRPTYAGISPKGYPEVASRFRDPAEENNVNSTDMTIINNRFGESSDDAAQNIPTDARGDVQLVNRLNTWPRENRPFWLLNAQQLEKHRNPERKRIVEQQNSTQNLITSK
ncbi:uncharacterized protein LOC126744493 [Anthonomus grandis grandis]|uniref:uncharacterized protein LOC126744493 n=1 Tax=Anthonomus grandis grandis TaxID=2921223 RepID=UPI002164FB2A|nr:uncharacterized protein LOC126744493 [Anthonomus grandis grandis]